MFDKRWFLLGVSLLLGVILLFRLNPPRVDKNVHIIILQQSNPIRNLDQTRNTSSRRALCIDEIAFPKGIELIQSTLGPLGYSRDFFLDFSGIFEVRQPGMFAFTISSDDGYRLVIDEETVGEFPTDRSYASDTWTKNLTQGKHSFTLTYFQGVGPLGLRAEYKPPGTDRIYLLGRPSDAMSFLPCQT